MASTAELQRQAKEHSERIRLLEQHQRLNETFGLTVSKLAHVVFGNGEPGISERVRHTSDKVDELEAKLGAFIEKGASIRADRIKEEQENRMWWQRTILAATISTIVAPSIPLIINALLLYAQYSQKSISP